MDENDILERFKKLFPTMQNDVVSYKKTGDKSLLIELNDFKVQFSIVNNGYTFTKL